MKKRIELITNKISSSFQGKLDDILNVCESPIEQYMFLMIVENFMKKFMYYDTFEFIIEWKLDEKWIEFEIKIEKRSVDKNRLKKLELEHREALIKLNKFLYPRHNKVDPPYRYAGIKFSEIFPIAENIRTISIIPQKLVLFEDTYYLIDIAIILEQHSDDKENPKIISKLALECDGHEYHSKPDAIKRDNQRARQLMTNGWKVIRFSGSEINNLDEYSFTQTEIELLKILFEDLPYY